MPPIAAEKMTAEQKKAAEEFAAGRGYSARGPFAVMLRSPEVMLRAKAMGDYLRFRNVLPKRVSEMVILITAREWTQQYEWAYHYGFALEEGLAKPIIEAIAEGRRPEGMKEDEAAAYDFSIELHKRRSVQRCDLCARAEAVRRAGHHRSDRRQRLLHLQRHDDERGPQHGRHRQGAAAEEIAGLAR